MTRYKIEITYGTFFHEYATCLDVNDAHGIAEMAARCEQVKEVRIIKTETVTTELQIRRFSISENRENTRIVEQSQSVNVVPPGRTVKCLHCREVVRAVDERCPYCHGDTSDFADFSVLT